jgi:hypothetical protein
MNLLNLVMVATAFTLGALVASLSAQRDATADAREWNIEKEELLQRVEINYFDGFLHGQKVGKEDKECLCLTQ